MGLKGVELQSKGDKENYLVTFPKYAQVSRGEFYRSIKMELSQKKSQDRKL